MESGGTWSIRIRDDTRERWDLIDPVLDHGEPAWVCDEGLLYVGDGEHPISKLRPVNGRDGLEALMVMVGCLLGAVVALIALVLVVAL